MLISNKIHYFRNFMQQRYNAAGKNHTEGKENTHQENTFPHRENDIFFLRKIISGRNFFPLTDFCINPAFHFWRTENEQVSL